MNKKQQIVLWTGIVTIVLICLFPPQYSWRSGGPVDLFSLGGRGGGRKTDTGRLIGYLVAVSVVTGGLTYTFRGKKDKKPKDE